MTDILIRNLSDETRELLRRRAERRGKSLEADLREMLERLARAEAESPDETEPFGTWLFSITRPGSDLDEVVNELRSATIRRLSIE